MRRPLLSLLGVLSLVRARPWVVAIGFALLAGCGGGSEGSGSGGNGAVANAAIGQAKAEDEAAAEDDKGDSRTRVVMTQAVDVAKGGSIVVQGSPLNGTVVNIPPNALGTSGTDTITIGYSNSLPGPLDPAAVAAGAKVVSKVIQLTHTSPAEFAASITVTVPYKTAKVGPNDVPIVLYWNESLKQYDAVKVISFSRTAGTITFRTHHFSGFIVGYINGLFAAMSGQVPFSVALAGGVDTKFRPDTNGFAVSNFSTINGVADKGACYGLIAFSRWNFAQNKPALFTNYFGDTNALIKNPLEQDLARELIYATYDTTLEEQPNVLADIYLLYSAPQPLTVTRDALAAQQLISYMVFTQLPQMLGMFEKSPTSFGAAHMVLAYSWKPNQGFMIYDPNSPAVPQNIQFNWPNFSPYVGEKTFTAFATDAPSSFYSDLDLAKLYTAAPFGSERQFSGKVSLLPQSTGQALYSIDTASGTTIYGKILSPQDPSQALPAGLIAYFYLDDNLVGPGEQVAADGKFNKHIPPLSLSQGKTSQELLVIVARQSPAGTTAANQAGISDGYFGTVRATLVPSSSNPNTRNYVYRFSFENVVCGFSESASLQIAGGGQTISDSASFAPTSCPNPSASYASTTTAPVTIALQRGTTYTVTFTYNGNVTGFQGTHAGYSIDGVTSFLSTTQQGTDTQTFTTAP